ncbi:MAG: phosphoribosylaminoimidazolesuccinocarboxamide synthase [Thermoplasmata archaeon]|nr:phosphoribosylaminoimidazolesuccinocarboxamide synthase [Candidatus Sysuiplasma acidicola]
MKLLRKGKVKEVYEAGADGLEFVFTDQISVFDKIISNSIPHKGDALCRTGAFWFQIARTMGIRTHFMELVASNRMRVKRVDIISDYSKINSATRNYLIPLEFVMRHYVAGSLMDRLVSGEVKPEDIGFEPGHKPEYGEKLNKPFFEVTTKLEPVDRHLTFSEALSISGLSDSDMNEIRSIIERIDSRIQDEVSNRGLIHVDGKKEFALDKDRQVMLVDTFGTSDEDRWWDADAYSQGRIEELSKEFVRQYYRKTGYYEMLESARKKGETEPPILPLPEDMVKRASDLYVSMFERITGESFN